MSDLSMNKKKDKNQQIQVFVRVRPSNQNELNGKSHSVIEVKPSKEIIVRERPHERTTKKFTFDQVFGPKSTQLDVYNAVVEPLVHEVLLGYNCTVFAYGQTGTGKTFTMEGHSNDPALHWQANTHAGIIPRSLSHLFDQLRLQGSQEYTVKVSFLELYNEELFDLLSTTDDNSKLRIYDDAAKKGSVIIQGLEEIIVHNKNEVYKILEKGSERRQTAATLMNANSSRSHTLFCITIHMKEETPDGEEFIKTGKLNLVDLAGSENVGRSGAIDRRAREAGSINQSLLTLGRVITSLVERAPHVPYRESKLTRLLQESLGGRTKTSIIATISPSSLNLEETLSTLDYAHRAKNITNRPEINQKLMKATLIKQYTEEIERLKRELFATRDRNGVYMAPEDYDRMQTSLEFQGKEIEEKLNHIKALEQTMLLKEKLFDEIKMNYMDKKQQVAMLKRERDEQDYYVNNILNVHSKLTEQATALLNVTETVTTSKNQLHDTIERIKNVEVENTTKCQRFYNNIRTNLNNMENGIGLYVDNYGKFTSDNCNLIDQSIDGNRRAIDDLIQRSMTELTSNKELVLIYLHNCLERNTNENIAWFNDTVASNAAFNDKMCESMRSMMIQYTARIEDMMLKKITQTLDDYEMKMKHQSDLFKKSCMEKIETMNAAIEQKYKQLCERLDTVKLSQQKENAELENFKMHEMEMRKLDEDYWRKRSAMMDNNMKLLENITTMHRDTIQTSECVVDELKQQQTVHNELKNYFVNDVYNKLDLHTDIMVHELADARNIIAENEAHATELSSNLHSDTIVMSQDIESYNNTIQLSLGLQREKAQTDLYTSMEQLQLINARLENSQNYQEERLMNQKTAITSSFDVLRGNLTDQNDKCRELQSTCVDEVMKATKKIESFVYHDYKQYESTGMTPIKQDFDFPRELIGLSPKERILQRYKLMKEQEEHSDDDLQLPNINDLSVSHSTVDKQNRNDTDGEFKVPYTITDGSDVNNKENNSSNNSSNNNNNNVDSGTKKKSYPGNPIKTNNKVKYNPNKRILSPFNDYN